MSDSKIEPEKSNVCFLRRGKRTFGPLTPQELKIKYEAGKLQPTDQVSKNETGPWRPVTDVTGIVFEKRNPSQLNSGSSSAKNRSANLKSFFKNPAFLVGVTALLTFIGTLLIFEGIKALSPSKETPKKSDSNLLLIQKQEALLEKKGLDYEKLETRLKETEKAFELRTAEFETQKQNMLKDKNRLEEQVAELNKLVKAVQGVGDKESLMSRLRKEEMFTELKSAHLHLEFLIPSFQQTLSFNPDHPDSVEISVAISAISRLTGTTYLVFTREIEKIQREYGDTDLGFEIALELAAEKRAELEEALAEYTALRKSLK